MKIIDAHAYIGESLYNRPQTVDDLLQMMDSCGVDRALLAPNRPKQYALWPANQMVAQVVRTHPERFWGMVRVDPWQGQQALDDLKRAHQQFGLQALLLHPWEEQFQIASTIVDPLVEYAAQEGMPVMIEAGYPLVAHPFDIAELANRHPHTTFIATHGLQLDSAGFALTDADVVMRECQNIIMETSGMIAPETMETLVRDLGHQRLIFGSHTPWFNLRLEVERVKLLNLPSNQIEAVLGGNLEGLLRQGSLR